MSEIRTKVIVDDFDRKVEVAAYYPDDVSHDYVFVSCHPFALQMSRAGAARLAADITEALEKTEKR